MVNSVCPHEQGKSKLISYTEPREMVYILNYEVRLVYKLGDVHGGNRPALTFYFTIKLCTL